MNYNFSMEDCTFYVNSDRRIIVCVLEDTKDIFYAFIKERLYFDPWCCGLNGADNLKFTNALNMPNRFVGIARCAEEDEWDEKLGRKIAYLRLREKVYRSFFNRARHYINTLDDYLERSAIEINRMGKKLDEEMENRNKYIAEQLSMNK